MDYLPPVGFYQCINCNKEDFFTELVDGDKRVCPNCNCASSGHLFTCPAIY